MGCHTWFYKKIETPTIDEIKSVLISRWKHELDFLNKLINDRSSIDPELLEAYPEWTVEYAEKSKVYWETAITTIDSRLIDEELCDLYCDSVDDITIYVDGRGWFSEVDEFHDVFRKYGYPDDMLFSFEQTMDYINNPDNKCETYDYTEKTLKEFWEKYPDGLIEFG